MGQGPAESDRGLTRRRVLGGAVTAGVGLPVLAACGGGGSDTASGPTGSGPLLKVSEIPEGGGVVVADRNLVATQPSKGTYKLFVGTCTHQGCQVQEVQDGTIDCPCHGSKFKVSDGSVVNGPATRALPAREIEVSGNSITLA